MGRIRQWVPYWHHGQRVDGRWVWFAGLRAWWDQWDWAVYLVVIVGLAISPIVMAGI